MTRNALITLMVLAISQHVSGAPIKVAFLNDDVVLEDTINALRDEGCNQPSLDVFRRAVRRYYNVDFTPPLIIAGKLTNGFYAFDSGKEFVHNLTNRLCDTEHFYEINCFDVVIGLVASQMSVNISRGELKDGPFLAVQPPDQGAWFVPVATVEDAFTVEYAAWYTNYVSLTSGMTWNDKVKCLLVSLYSWHVLPRTSHENLKTEVSDVLNSRWEMIGLCFPSAMQVTLLHRVSTNHHVFVTDHAGLLIPTDQGYTYIEKAGGQGPFVRIDLTDLKDLADYYASMINSEMWAKCPRNFITANHKMIGEIEKPQQSAGGYVGSSRRASAVTLGHEMKEMTRAEKGLLWSAAIFAFAAVALVVIPWVISVCIARTAHNADQGVMAFGMAFLPVFLAATFFAWLGSIIMGGVNLACNRAALRTPLGITTIVLDVLVLAYGVFWLSLVMKDLM